MPGDEVILYRAARCQDKDTVLSFAGGARRAELSYESSAVYGEAAQGRVVVALYGTEPDPQGALKMAINELPAKERGTCRIVPAEREGWPSDALLIAPESKNQPDTGGAYVPLVACGPLGVNGKKYSYWRIRQGFAWFIDLGEKDPDLDTGNMVIVTKTEGGAWRPKP
ncbi:hypothetical protein EM6_0038 [Asticcacaulis excentricus]|uniref:Uncharacterized protein n=2 Tax=Asticcacaulis excentricus TaxID=78587 RepID=A0A3G9FWH9_9CAUL|nr:hypothetical protein EM6_0038 [Asticcacaulis excentricus]